MHVKHAHKHTHTCTQGPQLQDFLLQFPSGSEGKDSACNAGDLGLIPGGGRSPGEGNGYPLQYCCLENSVDRGAWRAIVHGVHGDTTEWLTLHFCRRHMCHLATSITAAQCCSEDLFM